jgi:hypothetical protein
MKKKKKKKFSYNNRKNNTDNSICTCVSTPPQSSPLNLLLFGHGSPAESLSRNTRIQISVELVQADYCA